MASPRNSKTRKENDMQGQLVLTENLTIEDELEYKIKKAIQRYKTFEPKEGYYLAFSGGKDSQVIYHLAKMSGVKFESHYNITTVDPPELLRHIKSYYPDVIRDRPPINMWDLIPKKLMPPTRTVRYCCDVLKEGGGINRFVVTGVRWAESVRRKKNRHLIEFDRYGSKSKGAKEDRQVFLMSDNEQKRKMIETCSIKGKHILNPIIEWTDENVWQFIRKFNIPYCSLYDEGYKRLGCIGCPMQGTKGMEREFKRYPTYKKKYIKSFENMLEERKRKGLVTDSWKTGQEVFDWWLYSQ